MEGEVKEGFLCPLCYKDLKTASSLNAHFQEHSQDDQKFVKSFRGLYDKAIKKIKGSEQITTQESEPSTSTSRRVPGYPPSAAEDPSTVTCRSHYDRYKAIRDLRNERYASQTNTLLIRLGKLLVQLPTDPVRRKAYEQEVVPWLDDKDVNLCPGCAQPFHLLKRKHHCRLCGSVMCKYCTFLLPLDLARKMVGATSAPPSAPSSPLSKMQQQAVQAVLSLDGVTLSDLRICEHCQRLLNTREANRQNRADRPIIAQFYDRLRDSLQACDSAVVQYHDVLSSLCTGESKHTLDEAKLLRVDVIRLADVVDASSKKIATLGGCSDPPPSPACLKLQQSIRNGAAQYLKKKIISLPSLPTEQEIIDYQERRRLEIERRIEEERAKEVEEERKRSQEAREQLKQNNNSSNSSSPRKSAAKNGTMSMDSGWTPSVTQATIISDDPLLQQIGILHGYLEQARRAGRVEECEALQRNLGELEEALDQREAANKTIVMP